MASRCSADPTVIAPVPYAPPLINVESFVRFRRVEKQRLEDEVEVYHPRVPAGPGQLLHRFEAALSFIPIRRRADRLHRWHKFDLIHAHFIYTEEVVAARLGCRYGIPVVSTEQAAWRPWLDDYRAVSRQVFRALPAIDLLLPVSRWLQRNIAEVVGDGAKTEVVYNVVDEATFSAPAPGEPWEPDQILFVGLVRRVKGLDVLVRAFGRLAARRPELGLLALGAAFHRGYQRAREEVRRLVEELGLGPRVRFAGEATPAEVAAAMRRSAMLVVPSRRETFSAVTVETLESGTPGVATRCGGPEEFLTHETGRLVPIDDPKALAAAIEDVLDARHRFDPAALRSYALSRFGRRQAVSRLAEIYARVLSAHGLQTEAAGQPQSHGPR